MNQMYEFQSRWGGGMKSRWTRGMMNLDEVRVWKNSRWTGCMNLSLDEPEVWSLDEPTI